MRFGFSVKDVDLARLRKVMFDPGDASGNKTQNGEPE